MLNVVCGNMLLLALFVSCGKSVPVNENQINFDEKSLTESEFKNLETIGHTSSYVDEKSCSSNIIDEELLFKRNDEEYVVSHTLNLLESPIRNILYPTKKERIGYLHTYNSLSKLDICDDEEHVDGTYQSIAMYASYGITKAHSFLKKELKKDFGAVDLVVAPKVYKKVINNKKAMKATIKNTAQYTKFRNKSFITFYPAGSNGDFKLSPLMLRSMELWRHPIIGAHEYGHHVFYSILEENGGLQRYAGLGKSRMFTAVNEAFADLLAYYTLDEKDIHFPNYDSMKRNRNITLNRFNLGVDKTLSKEVVESFLEDEALMVPFASFTMAFKINDPHLFGAIFASIFYELTKDISKKESLILSIKWIKEFTTNLTKRSKMSEQNILKSAYKSMELIAQDLEKDEKYKELTSYFN